jgi:hypothetical protein
MNEYYCQTTVKALGFTDKMIAEYLSEPELKRNSHYRSAAPMKLWKIEEVNKVCAEIRTKLDAQLERRKKAALTRSTNKDIKFQALKDYLDTYSFTISNRELLQLISVSYKTDAIAKNIFRNYDSFCHTLAKELTESEVCQIEDTHPEYDFTYSKIYPIVLAGIKDKPILMTALEAIQADINAAEEQEARRLEVVRSQQEEILSFILENFDLITSAMDIDLNKLTQPQGNKQKQWKNAVNQNAFYVRSVFDKTLVQIEPRFQGYPKPKLSKELKNKFKTIANQLLSRKYAI